MAGQVKITDLPSKTSAASNDYMIVDNGTTTSKITKQNFLKDAVPQDYDAVKAQVETNKNDIGILKNSKQDSITDLADIRRGAAKGATAVQDAAYTHTDNNFTTEEKQKLQGLEKYDDSEIRRSLENKVDKEDGKGLFSGDYNDLTNKPTIPSLDGYATETWVNSQGFLKEHQSLDDYYTKEEADIKINAIISDEVITLENTWSSKKIADKIKDIELAKFPNVTIIGQPTIQQGQISNFSSTNYCQFPFVVDFQNQAFELDFEITTGSEVTQQHNVFDSAFGLAFAVRSSRFVVAISTNGTTWNVGEGVGTHTVLPNTTYRVKMVWDKTNFVVSYSTDGGTTYVTDITKALTEQPYPKQMFIGITSDKLTIFNGIINLNYAKLTIANKVVWQGMDDVGLATRMAVDMSNIDEAGVNKVKSISNEDNTLHYEIEGEDPDVDEVYTAAEVDAMLLTKADVNNVYTKQEIDEKLSKAKVAVTITSATGGSPVGNTINVYVNDQLQMSSAYNGSPVIFECSKGTTYKFTATDIKPFYDAVPIIVNVTTDTNLTIKMTEVGDTSTYEGIHQIVSHGLAKEFFDIGDQIYVDWTDTATGTKYNVPLDVVAFRDVELESGSVVPSMFMQWHYCTPFGVQFDEFEAFYCAEDSALPAGSYSFRMESGNIGSNIVAGNTYYFATTQNLPKGGLLCFNSNGDGNPTNVVGWADNSATSSLFSVALSSTEISGATNLGTIHNTAPTNGLNYRQRIGWGYNSWLRSGIRQYLNSKLDKYSWWKPQNKFDRFPSQLSSKNGHMSGYKDEFLNILGKIKITTFKNTVCDNGTADYTYDTFFLPSLEEVYCVPQVSGEGEYYPYWKIKSDTDAPNVQGSTNVNLRTFGIDNPNTAQTVRLRSANRTYANYTWSVNSSGGVGNHGASYSFRFAPVCAIV